MKRMQLEEVTGFIGHSSQLMAAMANTKRLKLLEILAEGEISVSDLLARSGFNQPVLSQHLGIFSEAGIIKRRKAGTAVYCSCTSSGAIKLLKTLTAIFNDGSQNCPEVENLTISSATQRHPQSR